MKNIKTYLIVKDQKILPKMRRKMKMFPVIICIQIR